MKLFNFFKRNKDNDYVHRMIRHMLKEMFPGGNKEILTLVADLKKQLKGEYDDLDIRGTLQYMASHVYFSQEKSADRVVRRGALVRPHNKFTEEDALIIYKCVVKQQYKRVFGSYDEDGFQVFYLALGNNEGGATTDIIPGAYGEYGMCHTNPIPVNGTIASETYLNRLRLISGEEFSWERTFVVGAKNIKGPIDVYEITTKDGNHLCELYISPYQSVTSSTAPKGFYIK